MRNDNFYCESRYHCVRRMTHEVMIGDVGVGGGNPIRVQSMTTTNTQDVDATVKQSIALAEAGCEVIRITAPNLAAARALDEIRKKFRKAGFSNPLVADIHFLPKAAMEAIEHVEKVRVNPGNYADNKKFAIIEYTDQQYNEELDRLYEGFSPLVKRAKQLGKTLRIGTNHGSLSDRIMNRYGDTPMGMVESALEFIRIAETHSFKSIILSMKASNPKVMIEAYRLAVAKMLEENMHYPLHLGVTEAGEGEDARVKSAIGIGSLLMDGLGDTIRVSLTEDPVYEIPVAKDLAEKAMAQWNRSLNSEPFQDSCVNPYEFTKRESVEIFTNRKLSIGGNSPVRVIQPITLKSLQLEDAESNWKLFQQSQKDARIEGAMLHLKSEDLVPVNQLDFDWENVFGFRVIDLESIDLFQKLKPVAIPDILVLGSPDAFAFFSNEEQRSFSGQDTVLAFDAEIFSDWRQSDLERLQSLFPKIIFYVKKPSNKEQHAIGLYRILNQRLVEMQWPATIWLRGSTQNEIKSKDYFSDRLLEASILSGSLLCDGIGELISVETEDNLNKSTNLAYAILQGARSRITKTEFVACPSCGRTLFDLQSTTQKIKEKTGHLKGVTIAVMGCIVNGPGEMADADFGYVGGAPAKVNLYVGKECVQYHIPEKEALDRLIVLIKKHKKWHDPE